MQSAQGKRGGETPSRGNPETCYKALLDRDLITTDHWFQLIHPWRAIYNNNKQFFEIPGPWARHATSVGLSFLICKTGRLGRNICKIPLWAFYFLAIPPDSVSITKFWNLKKLTHPERCNPGRFPNTWPVLQYHCPVKTREIYFPVW